MAENNKDIHIVFQVLNFIFGSHFDSYSLLPFHRLLLIALARHKGIKGIYPSIATLAKELKVSTRYLKTSLNHLESLKLISIDRDNGRSSRYYLDFLYSTEHPQITGDLQFTGDPQITPPSICRSPHRASVDHPINTEEELKRNNRESARKKSAPISPDFCPDQKTKDLFKELSIKDSCLFDIGADFIDYFLDSGESRKDWQFECRKWFKREVKMRGNEICGVEAVQKEQVQVQPKEKERTMTEQDRIAAKEAMAKIMLQLNGKGGSINGLLGNVRGHEKNN